MDANYWAARMSSASKRYHSARQSRYGMIRDAFDAEALMGFEEVDMNDDVREEYCCPFCSDYFDIVGLCIHIDEEHPAEANNGVCPVCGTRVGSDMVAHITLHHGEIFKMQRKRKSQKLPSRSTLSLLRKELREGNLRYLLGGSSYIPQPSNAAPDPLLSSFISPMSEAYETLPTTDLKSVQKNAADSISESSKSEQPPMSIEDREEKTKRCNFVQGLLISTILLDDDNL